LAFTYNDTILQISTDPDDSYALIKTIPMVIEENEAISSVFLEGKRLLVSLTNSTIYYYDDWINYGQPTRIFRGHKCRKMRVKAVLSRYNPNQILSGSEDGSIYVWNINSGRLIYVLKVHEKAATDLIEIGPNEYASCGAEGCIYSWLLP
jgi:WD40 repeat protein